MTALGIFLAGAGLFFVWCAVKGEDPRKVLVAAVTGAGQQVSNNIAPAAPR